MHENDAAHFAVEKKSNDTEFDQRDLLQIQAGTRARRRDARFQDVDMLEKYSPNNANNLPIAARVYFDFQHSRMALDRCLVRHRSILTTSMHTALVRAGADWYLRATTRDLHIAVSRCSPAKQAAHICIPKRFRELDAVQLHSYVDGMATPSGTDLCYALAARRKARHLSRLYDSHLASAGLTVSQFSILSVLRTDGRLKITELAQMLIMERTSLVRALKPLQAAGWVVAKRPGGQRSFDVMLSPLGSKKVVEAMPLWESAQGAFEFEVGRDRAIRLRNETLELNLGRYDFRKYG